MIASLKCLEPPELLVQVCCRIKVCPGSHSGDNSEKNDLIKVSLSLVNVTCLYTKFINHQEKEGAGKKLQKTSLLLHGNLDQLRY